MRETNKMISVSKCSMRVDVNSAELIPQHANSIVVFQEEKKYANVIAQSHTHITS